MALNQGFSGFSGDESPAPLVVEVPSSDPAAVMDRLTTDVVAFAATVRVKELVARALCQALADGDPITVEDLAYMEQSDVTAAIDGLMINEVRASAMQRAHANKLFHLAKEAMSCVGQSAGPVTVAPSAVAIPTAPSPPVPSLKASTYLDQADDTNFHLLSFEEIKIRRDRYVNLFGGDPPWLNSDRRAALCASSAAGFEARPVRGHGHLGPVRRTLVRHADVRRPGVHGGCAEDADDQRAVLV